MRYFNTLQYARENRKSPTKAEDFFWQKVRGRKLLNLKFNRQFLIEYADFQGNKLYYIADFHNFEYKLIIEVDGSIHNYQKEYDEERQNNIEALGYKVIRFTNHEVLNDWSRVEKTIAANQRHLSVILTKEGARLRNK